MNSNCNLIMGDDRFSCSLILYSYIIDSQFDNFFNFYVIVTLLAFYGESIILFCSLYFGSILFILLSKKIRFFINYQKVLQIHYLCNHSLFHTGFLHQLQNKLLCHMYCLQNIYILSLLYKLLHHLDMDCLQNLYILSLLYKLLKYICMELINFLNLLYRFVYQSMVNNKKKLGIQSQCLLYKIFFLPLSSYLQGQAFAIL